MYLLSGSKVAKRHVGACTKHATKSQWERAAMSRHRRAGRQRRQPAHPQNAEGSALCARCMRHEPFACTIQWWPGGGHACEAPCPIDGWLPMLHAHNLLSSRGNHWMQARYGALQVYSFGEGSFGALGEDFRGSSGGSSEVFCLPMQSLCISATGQSQSSGCIHVLQVAARCTGNSAGSIAVPASIL